jgi:MFS family permease
MYFSATIFRLIGFSSPTLTSLSIALTNFTFTLVAFYTIDRIGRRRILLFSIPIMVLGLLLCAVAFRFVDLSGQEGVNALPEEQGRGGRVWLLVILLAMITYVAGYAIGLGTVPWQQSELFPLSVRSLGSGISTATKRMSAMSMMLRRPRASARMPVSGEARSAKKDVDDVMRDLSRVVRGRWERDELIEIRVEDITPVLHV